MLSVTRWKVRLEGAAIKLQLWDASGQERFSPIVRNYYSGCTGFLMVYLLCAI
jgi:GTPase SAR1 family protein